jgi:hypothetical protein
MKISSGLARFSLVLAGACGLLLTSACVTTHSTQTTQTSQSAPYRSPLTGKEVVERLRGGAKQAELSQEIKQRGIVNVSAADMDGLKSAGASPELMDAILSSLAKGAPSGPGNTTVVVRESYPWVWAAYPFWAPHLGVHWSWHYRRR